MSVTKPAARSPTKPTPGFYLTSLVRKGWGVPCRLDLTDDRYTLEVDGERVPGSWHSEDLEALMLNWLQAKDAAPIVRVILWGKPCDQAVYEHRLAIKAWAQRHSPAHPSLSPLEPMNSRLIPIEEF